MPTFTYTARDERGKAVTGTMGAQTAEDLADQLKRMGYLVTRAREVREGSAATWSLRRRVPYDELVLFNVQLSKMIRVGIPLMTALKTLETQTTHRTLREAISDVALAVEGGAGFSEALTRHPAIFSRLFVSMIRAGEVSGKLDEILSRLAEFSQRQAQLREQLKTAMTYPCLLLVFGLAIITFLITGIIPKFMKIFVEAGVPLPWPTQLLFAISQAVRHYGLFMAAAAVGIGLWLARYLRTPMGRRQFDSALLRTPVVGHLARQAALAQFARTFETLATSGVPILESLSILEQTCGNVIIGEAITQVERTVSQGGSIAEPLAASRQFPPMAIQMITVGEASGTLDHMLGEIADHYDQMVRHGIARLTALIEPLFLGIMGTMVAFIMASVLLPLFKLINVVH